MHDRFEQLQGGAAARHHGLKPRTRALFHGPEADWFWVGTPVCGSRTHSSSHAEYAQSRNSYTLAPACAPLSGQ